MLLGKRNPLMQCLVKSKDTRIHEAGPCWWHVNWNTWRKLANGAGECSQIHLIQAMHLIYTKDTLSCNIIVHVFCLVLPSSTVLRDPPLWRSFNVQLRAMAAMRRATSHRKNTSMTLLVSQRNFSLVSCVLPVINRRHNPGQLQDHRRTLDKGSFGTNTTYVRGNK